MKEFIKFLFSWKTLILFIVIGIFIGAEFLVPYFIGLLKIHWYTIVIMISSDVILTVGMRILIFKGE